MHPKSIESEVSHTRGVPVNWTGALVNTVLCLHVALVEIQSAVIILNSIFLVFVDWLIFLN